MLYYERAHNIGESVRITAKAKAENRDRILEAAANLFKTNGFSQTTTRDISRATGLATGTLFNYFATKEELAVTLVGSCLSDAEADFQKRRRGGESPEELLFAHVAAILRHLREHRGYVEGVLRTGTGSSVNSHEAGEAERIWANHLGIVTQLVGAGFEAAPVEGTHGLMPSGLDLHLYWTLFLGVLNFWAGDESPHQEETLALLDQSMRLFVDSLAGRQDRTLEVNDGPISG